MEILLSAIYFSLFTFLIFRLPFYKADGLTPKAITAIFLAKVISGTILSLIYTYYYTDRLQADVFKFYDDSKIMFDSIKDKPSDFFSMLTGIGNQDELSHYYHKMNFWYRYDEETLFNDNHTIIRFNALIRIFSFGYFSVHTVFMNFLSLIGLLALYKVFSGYCKKKKLLIAGVFLWPSMMFWGSGVLKEGLLLFGLGLLIFSLHRLSEKKFSIFIFFIFIFSFLLMLITKYYVLAVVIPAIFSYFISRKFNIRRSWLVYVSAYFLSGLVALNLHHFKDDFNTLQVLSQKQRDFINLCDSLQAGSTIKAERLKPDVLSFARNTPIAVINALFRPHLLEIRKPLYIFAALETFITLIIILLVFFFRNTNLNEEKNSLWICLTIILSLALLVGLLTPVMGTIVRYKIPFLPFLGAGFAILFNHEAFITFVRKFKRIKQ